MLFITVSLTKLNNKAFPKDVRPMGEGLKCIFHIRAQHKRHLRLYVYLTQYFVIHHFKNDF